MRTTLPDPHARKCQTCIRITLNHRRRKNVSENNWLASTYWNPLILWLSAIIYLSHDLWDHWKNGNLFTLETFFTACLFLLSRDFTERETEAVELEWKSTQISHLWLILWSGLLLKRPPQPLGCVRSMKVCPGSVSAQWKSRSPLLLTPHYTTQSCDPGWQLKWVITHVRTEIHQKRSVLWNKCAFITFFFLLNWTFLQVLHWLQRQYKYSKFQSVCFCFEFIYRE